MDLPRRPEAGSALCGRRLDQRKRQVFMSPVVTHEEKGDPFFVIDRVDLVLWCVHLVGGRTICGRKVPRRSCQHGKADVEAHFQSRSGETHQLGLCLGNCAYSACRRRIPTGKTAHFGILVNKANPEMWALLHQERKWLLQVQEDIAWMSERLLQAGQGTSEAPSWEAAVDIITSRPRRWKRLIKIARGTALLSARWEAEKQQFYGLLLRQLRAAGATLPAYAQPQQASEVRAVCSQVFRDLRAWSQHAFKVHGRVREERKLVSGKQCPVCLKHFANTEKQCNHVKYSKTCKTSLLRAEFSGTPAPGVGSRRFDDGSRTLLPAVQAEGPRLDWDEAECPFEPEQPEESILLRLEDVFSHDADSVTSFEELLQAYRAAFSSACLQLSRLRATAEEWYRRLCCQHDEDEEQALQWSSWHSTIFCRLLSVDWAIWLVPDQTATGTEVSTFRDAELVIPWLQFDGLVVDKISQPRQIDFWLAHTKIDAGQSWTFQDFWEGRCPSDFMHLCLEPSGSGLAVFSCRGLLASLAVPTPIKSFKALEGDLRRLRL